MLSTLLKLLLNTLQNYVEHFANTFVKQKGGLVDLALGGRRIHSWAAKGQAEGNPSCPKKATEGQSRPETGE